MSPRSDNNSANAAQVFLTFLKLGLTSFGGPVAHLGYFRKELVERQGWVSDHQFGQLLGICQFLPGPASSQLGFSLGLLRAGWLGALAAFVAFTLPSAILLVVFAALLPQLSGDIGGAAIHGLKLVACAIVADAVWGMMKKLCPDWQRRLIALLAWLILIVIGSSWMQMLVVLAGGLAGLAWCRETTNAGSGVQVTYSKRISLALLGLFLLLLALLPLLASSNHLAAVAEAFYRSGALVFGGGHVVLPLLEEAVVGNGWVSGEDFLAGYGAAQAIPGPLFAFSAFLGAIIPSGVGGAVGGDGNIAIAGLALLFIFLPGFLLVTAAIPLWQTVSTNPKAASAIAGVNAAVVGILGAALYDPILPAGIQSGYDAVIVVAAFAALLVWRLSPLFIVIGCVAASLLPLAL